MIIKSNYKKGSNQKNANGRLLRSLDEILQKHNGIRASGSVASFSTKQARRRILKQIFKDLKRLGYQLENVSQFKERHVIALAKSWEVKKLMPSTLQTRMSVIRVFANNWLGKAGMIRGNECYFSNPALLIRSSISKTDKSWSGNNVDIYGVLEKVKAFDIYVGLALEFMFEFGLRRKEAVMFTPHLSDEGILIRISKGSKGGRERAVPNLTDSQHSLLERARQIIDPGQTLSFPGLTLAKALRRFSYVMTKFGITKKVLGATGHGLRHESAQRRFKTLSGHYAPIKNLPSCPDPRVVHQARIEIAEELGHSRTSITNTYFGKY